MMVRSPLTATEAECAARWSREEKEHCRMRSAEMEPMRGISLESVG